MESMVQFNNHGGTAADSSGKALAATAIDISVLDIASIPLSLTRVEPQNSAEGIEPNEPIALYFNQPVSMEGSGLAISLSLC